MFIIGKVHRRPVHVHTYVHADTQYLKIGPGESIETIPY